MEKKPTPNYYRQVFAVTRAVPYGRVTTYGAIADYLALGSGPDGRLGPQQKLQW